MTEHQCTCATAEADIAAIDLTLLDPILERFADDDGALIPILQATQEAYGYLPAPALQRIARRRGTPLAAVYGVATFYTQFHLEPRGKTIVKICHGTACHVAGAPEVTAAITSELGVDVGKTTEDMRFTVEAVACVGCCGLAPVVVTGEDVHGQMDAAGARKLSKQLLREAPK